MKQLDKDINRCFRNHILFEDRYGDYQIKLFHLLKAYSLYNTKIEYTQGMSSIAATLLIYLEEEKAFWAFVHLMDDKKYSFGHIFIPGFPGLHEAFYVLDKLTQVYFPKIAKHFVTKFH